MREIRRVRRTNEQGVDRGRSKERRRAFFHASKSFRAPRIFYSDISILIARKLSEIDMMKKQNNILSS